MTMTGVDLPCSEPITGSKLARITFHLLKIITTHDQHPENQKQLL